MITYRFEKVTRKQSLSLKCPCGKRFTKSVTVTHTVNPFNRDERGFAKTRARVIADVQQELVRKVEEWRDKPLCTTCREAA